MNSQNLSHYAQPMTAAARAWMDRVFRAQVARNGGIVRRSVTSVEREIGRDLFEAEVSLRWFYLLECGGQFIIICNSGRLQIIA